MGSRQNLSPQTDAATQDRRDRDRARLTAKEYKVDEGVDVCDLLGGVDTVGLIYLRGRLIDDLGGGPLDDPYAETGESVESVARFIVAAIEHEVGGRWVK